MAVKKSDLVPDGYSFRGANLDTGRCERFQIPIMVPGHNLDIRDNLDETLKKFWDILPLLELDFRDGVFHVAKKDELSGMSVVDDLVQLLKETGYL